MAQDKRYKKAYKKALPVKYLDIPTSQGRRTSCLIFLKTAIHFPGCVNCRKKVSVDGQ